MARRCQPTQACCLLLCALLAAAAGRAAAADLGIVGLDDLTFDKIVTSDRPVLVSFNKEYPWGDAHDAFKSLAETVGKADTPLLVAGVPISNTKGFEVNPKLAARFGLLEAQEGDLPAFRLFKAGADVTKPLPYKGDTKASKDALSKALLAWAVQETGVFVGLKGQVRELDVLAKAFMAAAAKARPGLLKDAQVAAEALDTSGSPDAPSYVEYYIKAMQRVLDKGEAYVEQESARLRKMAADKGVSQAKKDTFAWRLNVLASFGAQAVGDKSEL